MKKIDTKIEDIKIIEPKIFKDDRGYFVETFREDKLEEFLGYKIDFCQDNESKGLRGTLRGLHYQLPPFAQTKLVRVIEGKVLDVAVDIRKGSKTFGQHVAVELDSDSKRQLLVPRGFAHGFLVLSEEAIFAYKVDNYYDKNSERGIAYDDNFININWLLDRKLFRLSEKDFKQPDLSKADLFDIKEDLYI